MSTRSTRATSNVCSSDTKHFDLIDPLNGLDLSLRRLETEPLSEGTSNSSIVEMNNNTNGNMMSIDHANSNGNRQNPMTQVPVSPSVMKKIKQIYMEEVPLHLSGLSLSGSGMELYVKIDDKIDKAFRQSNDPSIKPVRTKKRKTRNRKSILQINRHNTLKNPPQRFGDTPVQNEVNNKQTNIEQVGQIPRAPLVQEKPIAQEMNGRSQSIAAPVNKTIANERLQYLKQLPAHTPRPYSPYGFSNSFQQSAQHLVNTIKGPSWNVANGYIDVMNNQDSQPSTSNMAAAYERGPMDFSTSPIPLNPFQGGFKSQNLPLKRRLSPPRFYNLQPIPEEERTCFDDCYEDVCANNGYKRKERSLSRERRHHSKERSKRRQIGETKRRTTKEDAAKEIHEKEKQPKRTSSDTSVAQSSVGPQFETDLIKPQSLDAETLLKFTEYTHAIRKDLKQKYKDLSKLVKSFEASVQERNNAETSHDDDQDSEDLNAGKQSGQCRVM